MHYHYITLTLVTVMALGSLSSSVHADDSHLSLKRDIKRLYDNHGQYTKRQGGRYIGGGIYRGEPDEDENEPDENEPDEDEPNEHGPALYYGSRVPAPVGHPSADGRFGKRQGGRYVGGSGIYRGEADEDENEPDEEEPDENERNEHGRTTYYGSRIPATFGHPSTYGRFGKRQGTRYAAGDIYRGEPDENEREPNENERDEGEGLKYGPSSRFA